LDAKKTNGPISTWMSYCLRPGKPFRYITSPLRRLSLLPSVGGMVNWVSAFRVSSNKWGWRV